MSLEIFPKVNEEEAKKDTLSIQAFGKRFVSDQSLYEYLLEFLLVFASAKYEERDLYKYKFHKGVSIDKQGNEYVSYFIDYKIALRRFIFFENSKREGQYKADALAYEAMMELISGKIRDDDGKDQVIRNIQDLLYGFSIVLKNRSWYAQSLLPLSPALIFGESMGEKKNRDISVNIEDFETLDNKFEFGRHNFFARGGEAYYLHVLRSLQLYPQYREDIEKGLENMICQVDELSQLSEFIQSEWEKEYNIEKKTRESVCGYIPLGYDKRSEYTCKELTNFLNSSINVLNKIEILAKGIVLQIIRMFHVQARVRTGNDRTPYWIVDMRSDNKNVRDFAEKTYLSYNEDIIAALHVGKKNLEYIKSRYNAESGHIKSTKKLALSDEKVFMKYLLEDGGNESYKVMKKLGKEIKLIIPAKGSNERFSLSEDLIKFLVISLVEPTNKVTFEHFTDMLFEHYGMIIGKRHMKVYCREEGIDESDASYFADNEHAFKQFLSNCGFLRELSDATSIVFNPYEREF